MSCFIGTPRFSRVEPAKLFSSKPRMNPWPAPSVQHQKPASAGWTFDRKNGAPKPHRPRAGRSDNTGGQPSEAAGRMERTGGTEAIGKCHGRRCKLEKGCPARDSATDIQARLRISCAAELLPWIMTRMGGNSSVELARAGKYVFRTSFKSGIYGPFFRCGPFTLPPHGWHEFTAFCEVERNRLPCPQRGGGRT